MVHEMVYFVALGGAFGLLYKDEISVFDAKCSTSFHGITVGRGIVGDPAVYGFGQRECSCEFSRETTVY